jgi:hypothetical protein
VRNVKLGGTGGEADGAGWGSIPRGDRLRVIRVRARKESEVGGRGPHRLLTSHRHGSALYAWPKLGEN